MHIDIENEQPNGGMDGPFIGNDTILSSERPTGSYEEELSEDPEKIVFRVSASRSFIFLDILVSVIMGSILGGIMWYLMRYHFFTYTYFRHVLLLRASLIAPPAIIFLWALSRSMSKLTKRYEVSRRFIRSALFAGVDIVETADMSKVIDCTMTRLLNVVSIRILTKDKTTPVIDMDYIDREIGEKLFAFISAHATESLVEMRGSRRLVGRDIDTKDQK